MSASHCGLYASQHSLSFFKKFKMRKRLFLSKQRWGATISQQTGQAGGGSILCLELNRWGAICPLC